MNFQFRKKKITELVLVLHLHNPVFQQKMQFKKVSRQLSKKYRELALTHLDEAEISRNHFYISCSVVYTTSFEF